jgi:hypothetical protein
VDFPQQEYPSLVRISVQGRASQQVVLALVFLLQVLVEDYTIHALRAVDRVLAPVVLEEGEAVVAVAGVVVAAAVLAGAQVWAYKIFVYMNHLRPPIWSSGYRLYNGCKHAYFYDFYLHLMVPN